MQLWHECWKWTHTGQEQSLGELPFWDITALLRRAIRRRLAGAESPEHLFLLLVLEGDARREALEESLRSLGGGRFSRKSLLRLQAVCGQAGGRCLDILRLGNTDLRLGPFPLGFLFSLELTPSPLVGGGLGAPLHPSPGVLGAGPVPGASEQPEPLPGESLSDSPTLPSFCHLEFQAVTVGLPPGNPAHWWALLNEGRSVWDAESERETLKVSVLGEVARTLAAGNSFRRDFVITL